jgi:hypothetical protein
MVLMVLEGCEFCRGLGDIPGLSVFPVVRDSNNQKKLKVGDALIDPPYDVKELPALLDMDHLYIGRGLILSHLKEKGCLVD